MQLKLGNYATKMQAPGAANQPNNLVPPPAQGPGGAQAVQGAFAKNTPAPGPVNTMNTAATPPKPTGGMAAAPPAVDPGQASAALAGVTGGMGGGGGFGLGALPAPAPAQNPGFTPAQASSGGAPTGADLSTMAVDPPGMRPGSDHVPYEPVPADVAAPLIDEITEDQTPEQIVQAAAAIDAGVPAGAIPPGLRGIELPGREGPNAPANQPQYESALPTMEGAIQQYQTMLDQWMGNLDQQYASQQQDILQQGLNLQRGASNRAAQMGQSFGGSFADAQRQAMLSTQGSLNEANRNYLGAQQGLIQQGMDFQREQARMAYEDQVRQQTWERDDYLRADERQYQEDQILGELEGEFFDTMEDFITETGQNPFMGPGGEPIPYENLDPSVRRTIANQAQALDMEPQEFLDQLNPADFNPGSVQDSQQKADILDFRNRAANQSDDFDDLMGLEGTGNWEDIYKEIMAVIKDGIDPDELVANTWVSEQDLKRAREEEG